MMNSFVDNTSTACVVSPEKRKKKKKTRGKTTTIYYRLKIQPEIYLYKTS